MNKKDLSTCLKLAMDGLEVLYVVPDFKKALMVMKEVPWLNRVTMYQWKVMNGSLLLWSPTQTVINIVGRTFDKIIIDGLADLMMTEEMKHWLSFRLKWRSGDDKD